MPEGLREHLRYPEDLFRVQTELYSKYQLPAEAFFERAGAWSVAQAPTTNRQSSDDEQADTVTETDAEPDDRSAEAFASESDVARFVPYYTMFRNTAGDDEFVILRPFVPFSTNDDRTELQAYMTASSDPGSYGELVSYVVTQPELPSGPSRVADQQESEENIGPELNRLASEETGTQVRFGDLQLVPVADGLVYVRPVYVYISGVTEYRLVIVSHNDSSAMSTTLEGALAQLFPGFSADLGDRPSDDTTDPSTPDEPGGEAITGDVVELLVQAAEQFTIAEQALADGDLGAYQAAVERARQLVEQATTQLDAQQ